MVVLVYGFCKTFLFGDIKPANRQWIIAVDGNGSFPIDWFFGEDCLDWNEVAGDNFNLHNFVVGCDNGNK